MKKSTIGVLSFFALIAMTTACKKEYSCKCTGSFLGQSADTTIALGKLSKKDAKSQCNSHETNMKSAASIASAVFGIPVSVDCEVK